MLLLQSWKESFDICKPKNLKLLGLVTLKSIVQAYTVLLSYLWWLILLLISLELSCYYLSDCLLYDASRYLIVGIKIMLCICMFAIARPSGGLKDMDYMKQYSIKSMWVGLLYALIVSHVSYPMFFIVSMISAFAVFFYLDSYGTVTDLVMSFVRALLMVIYNLPVCLLCIFVCIVCFQLLYLAIGTYSTNLLFFLLPCLLAFIKNIYVKRLHDQFNLYYRLV